MLHCRLPETTLEIENRVWVAWHFRGRENDLVPLEQYSDVGASHTLQDILLNPPLVTTTSTDYRE